MRGVVRFSPGCNQTSTAPLQIDLMHRPLGLRIDQVVQRTLRRLLTNTTGRYPDNVSSI